MGALAALPSSTQGLLWQCLEDHMQCQDKILIIYYFSCPSPFLGLLPHLPNPEDIRIWERDEMKLQGLY